jgi:hypothetical protein
MYFDGNCYYFENDNKKEKCQKIEKKQNVFITNIPNLINQYKIQNIGNLIINLNINNCDDLLETFEQYNHIISHIEINEQINFSKQSSVLKNFYNTCELTPNFKFVHKNLNLPLPTIGIYLTSTTNNQLDKLDKLSLMMQQYQMNLILNKTIITYPDSIKLKEIQGPSLIIKHNSKVYHEKIIENLENVFEHIKEDTSIIDIVIQFNPNYLQTNNSLQIMSPLKDNVIYVNKMFDILYATRNCMYMLYQIVKSNYFLDYISEKKQNKPSVFNFFSKSYFYDYISKIFVIKEFK